MFCVTHRVHFFLPHRVQWLFWMVPHRAHLVTFYLKFGIPHFAAEKISFCLKYLLCYPSCALFSAPSCAVSIMNGAPSSAPVYFLFKGWYTSFSCRENLFCWKYVLCYPSCALFSAPSCAVIILNGAPSSAPVYFLFMVYLIFLQ